MTTSNTIPLGSRIAFGRPVAAESRELSSASMSVVTTPAMPSESTGDTTDGMGEPGEIRQTHDAAVPDNTSKNDGWGATVATAEEPQKSQGGGWSAFEPSTSTAIPFVSAGW